MSAKSANVIADRTECMRAKEGSRTRRTFLYMRPARTRARDVDQLESLAANVFSFFSVSTLNCYNAILL